MAWRFRWRGENKNIEDGVAYLRSPTDQMNKSRWRKILAIC